MTLISSWADQPGSELHNEAGAFLCVEFYPAGGDRDKPPGKRLSQQENSTSTMDAPRILIVEDVLLTALHLEALLGELDFEVCGLAADGQDAIEQAAQSEPNLLLIDLNLGEGIDGIEAARRIRETSPIAVIFVTAYSDAANLDRIDRAFPGAPVLSKPVMQESLREAIIAVRRAKST